MSAPPPAARDAEARRFDAALTAILLLAFAFRLYRLDAPLVDAHSWRQVTNADIARHFAEGSLNPFLPRVSWGGATPGVVGMEFPLLQWITGVFWWLGGERATVARLIAVFFSMAAVWLTYLLGARWFGRPAGLASAFLLAVSPGVVFFGRSFLSDTPMVAFSVAAVLAWDLYFERRDGRWAAAAAVATALTGLVKLPGIVVLGGIFGLAWSHLRWRAFADRRLAIGVAAAALATGAWYGYADWIWQQTGLTQAVFRPSGTYPPDVAPGVTFTTVSHWATRERLLGSEFWWVMLDRLWDLYLTPFGFLAMTIGLWMAWLVRAWGVGLWTLSGLALAMVAAEGQFWHEFHTLPLVLPLVIIAGLGAAPLFDASNLARYLPLGRLAPTAVFAMVMLATLQSFRGSGALRHLYRAESSDYAFLEAGAVTRSMTDQAPMITVDYIEGGANSPMMLYFSHRLGWSFDVRSISVEVIEHLRKRDARYFATTRWYAIEDDKPEVASYLNGFKGVVLPGEWPRDFKLVDLRSEVRSQK